MADFACSTFAVGPYQLSVQLSGFGSAHTAFTLKVGDQVDVPIVLQAAGVTEAVQVQAPRRSSKHDGRRLPPR